MLPPPSSPTPFGDPTIIVAPPNLQGLYAKVAACPPPPSSAPIVGALALVDTEA